jgi:uncharacterized membrane-anchored protein YhcB (DUF1043 family)
MGEQTVDLAQVVSIIVALIGVLGTLIGAFVTARFALRNYQEQKVADRENYRQQNEIDRQVEAMKNRGQSYKDYLTAYANVQAWPGGDAAVYAELYDKYYDACHNLFQVAVDNVFRATTAFH